MLKFKSYTLNQLEKIPQLSGLSEEQMEEIRIVSSIYPFKTNNYVLEKLIDWNNIPDDPIFRLNFPHKEMLLPEDFEQLKEVRANGTDQEIKDVIYNIRMKLNPHPAGQTDLNSAFINEDKLEGIQHKYRDILLFFPSQSQTCHAYCTFCFRWPQFINDLDFKIQSKEINPLLEYLDRNPQISEVLFTGGDPMIMNSRVLESYIEPLLKIDSIKTIRIGTKALSYWPYKFTTDEDAEGMLNVLEKITKAGKHLGFMAHFNHPVELDPPVVKEAIDNLRKIGATIRTQSPLLRFINNRAETWTTMWEKQVQLNCIPYYMFLPRDTGAQHYFAETLERAHEIYIQAIRNCTGLASTAKGPVMSTTDGKVEILDVRDNQYTLRYVKHRDENKTFRAFTAQPLHSKPMWIDDLIEMKSEIMNY
ncbi:KamA family radical SAM protein [Flavobacterium aestivum]|uniref:KamA family radical SAM protein n=1 Tax=Flavobacterium aestivum TaxID=3003257 RepID=UPI002482AF3E|nr:lysine 2,3-aminomutase [Flavobacterium aestivum]